MLVVVHTCVKFAAVGTLAHVCGSGDATPTSTAYSDFVAAVRGELPDTAHLLPSGPRHTPTPRPNQVTGQGGASSRVAPTLPLAAIASSRATPNRPPKH